MTSPTSSPLGASKPRVEVRPDSITATYGDIAAKLMAAAKMPLEQWQADAVDLLLSTREDGKWACYEYAEWVARQNGKGTIGEARALVGFLVLGENLILWSAHQYRTAMEAFRRIRAELRTLGTPVNETLVDLDGVAIKINNTNGEEGFERLDTGQRIKFVARSKSSGRGFTGDVNIIDESFAYTEDQQDALMPTLIARPNAQILYLSSPPLSGDTGPVMFNLKRRAESGGGGALGYRDWGVEGDLEHLDALNLDDTELWAASNPALGRGRVSLESITRLRESMTRDGFAREVLGIWPTQLVGGGAIDVEQWARLLDGSSKRDGDVAIAVDIAPQRDYAAIAVYGHRSDGIGHLQLVDYRPGTDWVIDRIVEWNKALAPVGIAVGHATGASLKVELEKVGITQPDDPDKPVRGDLVITTATEMTAATGQMLDAVRQSSFRHIGQSELDASVAGAKTKVLGDTVSWARKESDADTCPLVAASLARWVFDARAHLVRNATYDVLTSVW